MTEAELQRDVIRFLDLALDQPAVVIHVPNNPRNAIAGRNLKTMGLRKGATDLLVFAQGQAIAIELKKPGGRVQPEQAAMLEALRGCGVSTAVCRSVEDVEMALANAGVRMRARAA